MAGKAKAMPKGPGKAAAPKGNPFGAAKKGYSAKKAPAAKK